MIGIEIIVIHILWQLTFKRDDYPIFELFAVRLVGILGGAHVHSVQDLVGKLIGKRVHQRLRNRTGSLKNTLFW